MSQSPITTLKSNSLPPNQEVEYYDKIIVPSNERRPKNDHEEIGRFRSPLLTTSDYSYYSPTYYVASLGLVEYLNYKDIFVTRGPSY